MATLRASRRNGCCLIKGHHPSRAEHTPEWKECKSRTELLNGSSKKNARLSSGSIYQSDQAFSDAYSTPELAPRTGSQNPFEEFDVGTVASALYPRHTRRFLPPRFAQSYQPPGKMPPISAVSVVVRVSLSSSPETSYGHPERQRRAPFVPMA